VLPLGLGSATGAADGSGTAGVVVVREVHHLLGFLALAAKIRGFWPRETPRHSLKMLETWKFTWQKPDLAH